MLSVPDGTVHRTKVADWLELKAIGSEGSRVSFSTLASAAAIGDDEQSPDIGEEDQEEDELILTAQSDIERRHANIGDDYPFRIDDKGRALQFVTPLSKVGSVYLFCLFLSHAADHMIVPKGIAPGVTNKVRDLFQACATVAAGGYVRGPSMSFGFPRPDGKDFLRALRQVYRLFGDGKPRAKPRKASSKHVKDNGIDIIAWCRAIDNLPATHYLVGQVASGRDWVDKSVKPDREHFHDYWFTCKPASQAEDAMFIPFELEPENWKDVSNYGDLLSDHMQNLAYRYGNVFYRDRVVKHLAAGLQLTNGGEKHIQRADKITDVQRWVEKYMKRLRAA